MFQSAFQREGLRRNEPDGIITRVPFVKEIVTEVDIDDGCIVVNAPAGLFSDEELEGDNEDVR